MNMDNRHIVVTGGGTGLGRAMAETFAHAGAKVTIMGCSEAPLRMVATLHKFIGWVTCDVTDPPSVRAAFRQARDLNGPVSVVVANAGAADSVPFQRLTPDQLQAMLAVNLSGVVNAWQAGLPDMQTEAWGRLIAIASTAGLKGVANGAGCAAAKHAVVGMTRSLALELAESGITANAICPGFTETPMLDRTIDTIVEQTGMEPQATRAALMAVNPQNRFIQTDEVAGAALWLCSDAARGVNGHALSLSGGEI